MSLTIPQKLEALQAVVDNPDIGWYDTPHHYCTYDIIDDSTPCRITEQGQALWERFTKHLNTGYKKLTTGERLFWLTTYTGENQPDDTQLLDIIRTSTSSEVREAAATHYAARHHEHDVTDTSRTFSMASTRTVRHWARSSRRSPTRRSCAPRPGARR